MLNDPVKLEQLVDAAFVAKPKMVAEIKSGKHKAINSIVGSIIQQAGQNIDLKQIVSIICNKLNVSIPEKAEKDKIESTPIKLKTYEQLEIGSSVNMFYYEDDEQPYGKVDIISKLPWDDGLLYYRVAGLTIKKQTKIDCFCPISCLRK